MAVFNIFKRLVTANTAVVDRREEVRVRATLGARVLVVDDSATIRAVLGKMLMQDGYEVLKAEDGEAAVETARAQFPDLIFLDIVLPGMSGFAVLRQLRRDSRTRTTPIVMMSGNQQATEQFYVQRFGADGFIKKPFGRGEVFHAIRTLVQAGRMPVRADRPAVAPIPEGMSAEEWEAIPDVAMPDDAHMTDHPEQASVNLSMPVDASAPAENADAPAATGSTQAPPAPGTDRPAVTMTIPVASPASARPFRLSFPGFGIKPKPAAESSSSEHAGSDKQP
jgi:DNA-binding response OmpR family regulator